MQIGNLISDAHFDGGIYERDILSDVFKNLDSSILERVFYNLKKDADNKCFNGVFRLKEVIYYLKATLEQIAKEKAQRARIKDFNGSRLEEIEVLEKFILKEFYKKIPSWV